MSREEMEIRTLLLMLCEKVGFGVETDNYGQVVLYSGLVGKEEKDGVYSFRELKESDMVE